MRSLLIALGFLVLLGAFVACFMSGMAEIDQRRRRAYLNLCLYCGQPRHVGECSKDPSKL